MIKVSCALIVDRQGRLLAAQRSSGMSMPFKWEFPGGKIEPDETAEQCLIREIKEELDVDIQIIKALPANTHAYPAIVIELVPFLCKLINGQIVLKEHAQFEWFHPNELLALDWANADLPVVKNYLNLIHGSS